MTKFHGNSNGLVMISEEKLWDFVRDGFHDGIANADKYGDEIDRQEDQAWMESEARKQVMAFLERQKENLG